MSERFTKLYELQKNLYSEGSPIVVSAGALLKDTQTNNIIVQLKFHSVSATAIKALKVGVAAFDIAGKEIDGVSEYQYLDLSIRNGQRFGSNKAIIMPNSVTRSFSIKSITVVLADGQIHSILVPLSILPQPTAIHTVLSDAELIKQYKLKTNDSATYVPQESHGLWQCHCGEWNVGSVCSRCRGQKSTTFAALDLPSLTEEMNARLAEEAQRKAEAERLAEIDRQEKEKQLAKKQAEREAQQKEIIKKAKIAAIIFTLVAAIALMFALWIWPDILQPSIEYNSAVTLLEEEKYSDAIAVFETLIDYKDSADLLLEAKYRNGQQLLQEQYYPEAISQFAELGTYEDSQTLILEAKYRMALRELSVGDDAEALELLAAICPYSNSEKYLSEYQFILTFVEDYLPDYGIYSKSYNESGLIISYTTRSGIIYSYEYDVNDRLISMNGNDKTTEYTYDTSSNLVAEETSDELIEYFYNQDNQLICKRRTKYTYVLGIECPEVYWITFFEYANGGDLVREYEWLDSEFNPLRISIREYEYSSDHNCIAENEYLYDGYIWIHDVGNKPYLQEDIKAQLDSMQKELCDQMKYVYSDGLLIEKNHIGGSRITYQYENDLLIRSVDHTYDITYTYHYDNFGNLIREDDTDGGWVVYTYTPVFGGDRP